MKRDTALATLLGAAYLAGGLLVLCACLWSMEARAGLGPASKLEVLIHDVEDTLPLVDGCPKARKQLEEALERARR